MQKSFLQLSKSVYKISGLNPGPFTLDGTNTYLVGQGKSRILIDTGENKVGYLQQLQQLLLETNSQIDKVFITHSHQDHTLGIKDILQINQNVAIYKFDLLDEDKQLELLYNFKYQLLKDNDVFDCGELTLQAIHFPGHVPDHFCYYLVQEKVFFSGDFILGGSSNVITDMKLQINSYNKALSLDIENIFPGHGNPIFGQSNSKKAIEDNKNHRLQREEQIIDSIKCQGKEGFVTKEQILSFVYPGLQQQLIHGALNNILVHLNKLIQENIVQEENGLYKLTKTN